ncbi:MAG: phosphomannomutase CpsG [Balneolales bacterium]
MTRDLSAFKAYDIRGIFHEQVDATFMHVLAQAYTTHFKPKNMAIGYDARTSSEELADALSRGFQKLGVDVLCLGLCGTEMVYFATGKYQMDGGIMITASHNPKEYNGCKMVSRDSKPVGVGSGMEAIKKLMFDNGPFMHIKPELPDYKGKSTRIDIKKQFVSYLTSLLTETIHPDLKVVVNSGNGAAGPTITELAGNLPCQIEQIYAEPDGHFPNGVPNPLLPENRDDTTTAVLKTGADLGAAFDGDFDRCFFFDENGRFIEGYYIVGLLAEQILQKKPGAKIIHDPRLTWNTIEIVKNHGGIPVVSKTGHAFLKQSMRKHNAEYGGEMSAHHYFRDFWYCDTGILPLLLILELLSTSGKSFSELVNEAIARYPVSGEMNFSIRERPDRVIKEVENYFSDQSGSVMRLDGLSMEFDLWRFSLRASNTEPLLRLNVEARSNISLMESKRDRIIQIIKKFQ